jgi:hypothetical protein
MKHRNWLQLVTACCLSGLLTGHAAGTIITYTTAAGGSTTGGPVDASATFTTSTDTLTITLENLLVDAGNVAQLVSDLEFTLSGLTGTSTLLSSSAQEITINGDGTSSTGAMVSTGWTLTGSPGGLVLCVICSGGNAPIAPAHTLIGPGPYTSANGSIAGNGPHNPFLNQVASFTISNASITANTIVTSAIFSFGTVSGLDVIGTPGGAGDIGVPEPGTLLLLAGGLLAAGFLSRLRRKP